MELGREGLLQACSEGRRRRRDALVVPRRTRQTPCELDQGQGITCSLAEHARAQDRVQFGCTLVEQFGRG